MLSRDFDTVIGTGVSEQLTADGPPLPGFAAPAGDPAGDIESLIQEAGRQVGRATVVAVALLGLYSLFF